LYGSAIEDRDTYRYKLALYEAAQADVVAVGSSRTMQLRQQFFTAPFVTLGGGVHSLEDARRALRDLRTGRRPKMVLLALDFWWFNRAATPAEAPARDRRLPKTDVIPPAVFLPARWLLEGKLSLRAYAATLRGRPPASPFPLYGAAALARRRGYARDGSLYDFDQPLPPCGSGPVEFPSIARLARHGRTIYLPATVPDPEAIQLLDEMLAAAEQDGLRVITFFPPVTASVAREIEALGERYAYIGVARDAIRAMSGTHYDFHDPVSLGLHDCQFLDEVHASDLGYAALIRRIAADRTSGLAPFAALGYLDCALNAYAGQAALPVDPEAVQGAPGRCSVNL
jgi:hypothetical protein